MHSKVQVIYQDAEILVVNKPPGLLSSKIDEFQDSLEKIFGGFLVHRLDKDTSGLVIIAKTLTACENLREQFKNREVKKEYVALVHGVIPEPGLIDVPIAQNPKIHDQFIVSPAGRLAATKYEPVRHWTLDIGQLAFKSQMSNAKSQMKKLERMKYNEFTLLKVYPLTGRTHQIRVHLKYVNHPIVSDEQYVGRKIYKIDEIWCPRQFLHAAKIGFNHSSKGNWIEFESQLPEDLEEVLEKLKVKS